MQIKPAVETVEARPRRVSWFGVEGLWLPLDGIVRRASDAAHASLMSWVLPGGFASGHTIPRSVSKSMFRYARKSPY